MPYSYLKGLGLTAEAELALQSLGARSPFSLLSMIDYSRASFVQLIGERQTQLLEEKLLQIVPAEEREKLSSAQKFRPKFGALKVNPTDSPQTAAARQERDQLVEHIRQVRESQDQSQQAQELLQMLEQRLRDILKETIAVNQT